MCCDWEFDPPNILEIDEVMFSVPNYVLTYHKIPNNSRGVYLFQSFNKPGVYLGPGSNLGQVFNSFLSKIWDENVTNFTIFSVNSLASFWAIVVRLLQVKLLRRRKLFSRPALTANSSSLLSLTVAHICFSITLIILRDTLSWCARLLITQPCMFISSSSLAFFLPPPGSLALLLSSSDRRWSSVWFFRQSLTLFGSAEKRLAAASPEFSSAYNFISGFSPDNGTVAQRRYTNFQY